MSQRRIFTTIIMMAFGLLSFWSLPTLATDCSAICEEAIGCHGNCTIEFPSSSNCGVICYTAGCDYTCKGIGPAIGGESCKVSISGLCRRSAPPPVLLSSEWDSPYAPQWIILSYETDFLRPILHEDIEVLASSSPSLTRTYPDAFITEQSFENRDNHESRSKSDELDDAFTHPQTYRHFFISPVSLQAVSASLKLDGTKVELDETAREFPNDVGMFFRADADHEGHLSNIEILYSLSPDVSSDFEDLLIRHGRLASTEKHEQYRFFGYVLANNGTFGTAVAAAFPLN